jgi:hypothetical protein
MYSRSCSATDGEYRQGQVPNAECSLEAEGPETERTRGKTRTQLISIVIFLLMLHIRWTEENFPRSHFFFFSNKKPGKKSKELALINRPWANKKAGCYCLYKRFEFLNPDLDEGQPKIDGTSLVNHRGFFGWITSLCSWMSQYLPCYIGWFDQCLINIYSDFQVI